MSIQEDVKVNDYFMKNYNKGEILKTFKIMIGKFGKTGEMKGKLEDIKIVRIDEKVITVEAKMEDSNGLRLYRMSLEFPQMENEEFSREAKIASPERTGEIIELKINGNEEKIKYFEKRVDYWDNQEEIAKRIEKARNENNFMERYGKENINKVVDIMIQNSSKSGDILGDVLDYKIVGIEGTTISVAVKTKDDEKVRIYRINLDFDKMKNIGYTDKAKTNSATRTESTKELQTSVMSNEEKFEYYDKLPNIFGENREEQDKNIE